MNCSHIDLTHTHTHKITYPPLTHTFTHIQPLTHPSIHSSTHPINPPPHTHEGKATNPQIIGPEETIDVGPDDRPQIRRRRLVQIKVLADVDGPEAVVGHDESQARHVQFLREGGGVIRAGLGDRGVIR